MASQLQALGYGTFAPILREIHRWSDRRKNIEIPLFPSYAFVKLCPTTAERVRVLQLFGVNGFVGSRGQGTPIPDKQIEDIRTLIASNIDFSLIPFLKIGQKVRVRGGCLDGVEGILMARKADHTLLISVEPIQQTISVRIDGYQFEPI